MWFLKYFSFNLQRHKYHLRFLKFYIYIKYTNSFLKIIYATIQKIIIHSWFYGVRKGKNRQLFRHLHVFISEAFHVIIQDTLYEVFPVITWILYEDLHNKCGTNYPSFHSNPVTCWSLTLVPFFSFITLFSTVVRKLSDIEYSFNKLSYHFLGKE